ncbi:MAG: PAAR-like protein [Acidobacteriota bacterium]
MGSPILHSGATVQCMHTGQAQPVMTNLRVKVSQQAIVTQSNSYTVAGCIQPSPPNGNGPCVSAQWTSAATRVKAGGDPVLTTQSQAVCVPTGTGLNIVNTQTRVKAT